MHKWCRLRCLGLSRGATVRFHFQELALSGLTAYLGKDTIQGYKAFPCETLLRRVKTGTSGLELSTILFVYTHDSFEVQNES